MRQKITVAVIGAGYWGKNLIRVLSNVSEAEVKYIVDINKQQLANLPSLPNTVQTLLTPDSLWQDHQLKAVFIATPTSCHYELAKTALVAGKHVWVEKPMTTTYAEAEELVNLAKQRNLILHVDHTFLYGGPVMELRKIINSQEFGELRYLDSERRNLGLVQPDVNVLHDLATHDLSIFQYLLQQNPISVQAIGASFVTQNQVNPREEIAHVFVRYPNNVFTHIATSWISPIKTRRIIVGGSKQMAVYNDIDLIEKIKIYNSSVTFNGMHDFSIAPVYRVGSIVTPYVDNTEPLFNEVKHFIACLKNNSHTLTDGEHGAMIARILEEANKSLQNNSEIRFL